MTYKAIIYAKSGVQNNNLNLIIIYLPHELEERIRKMLTLILCN